MFPPQVAAELAAVRAASGQLQQQLVRSVADKQACEVEVQAAGETIALLRAQLEVAMAKQARSLAPKSPAGGGRNIK